MAEYYPLLARAIAGLPQSTPETRRAIYDRAKTALIGQLRAVQPPIAEDDIQRESRMLDEAIARLEREAVPASAPAAPATPPAAASPPPPEPRRPIEPIRRPEGSLVRPAAQSSRPALPPRPSLPPRPGSPVSDRSASLGALDAARQRLASLNRTPAAGVSAPATPAAPAPQPAAARPAPPKAEEPRREAKPIEPPPPPPVPVAQPAPPPPAPSAPSPIAPPPPVEAREPASVSPPPPSRTPGPPLNPPAPEPRSEAVALGDAPAIEAPKPVPTEAAIAASRLAADAGAERRETPGPMNVTLRKYGPRAEAAGVSADLPPPEDSSFDEPRMGAVRPAAPLPPQEKERNFRPLLIGLPVALVVGAIAVFAYVRRDNPEELARLRPAPGAEAPAEQATGKIVERIGGGQAARTNDAPAQPQQQAPAQQPTQQAQPGQQAPAASNGPVAPATQRAALLVDAPDEAQRVRTYVGNVVWRLDNVSRGPGQPLAIGVRAELDLPDAKLRAVVLIQKNTDDTLPASHTIEVRFTPTDGGPIPGVAQISTPQMRKEDTPAGDALMGVPAPILRNFFLVGLTRGDTAAARNMDLLRTRGWIDIPMLLSDQRIAKITFEKGAAGERVVNEALEAWK